MEYKWIYCEDKLPREYRQVLVAIKWSKYGDIEVSLGEYWGEDGGWGEYGSGDNIGKVVAWTEVPTFEGRACYKCHYNWTIEKHHMCQQCGYKGINNFIQMKPDEDEKRSRRAAYAEGITSEQYIETGEPQIKIGEAELIEIEKNDAPLEDTDTINEYNIKMM